MQTQSLIDYFPTPALLPITLALVALAISVGYRLAIKLRREGNTNADGPITSVVGGTLGFLGLLIAFTFGMSASRFDTRRDLLLAEVEAIHTCYLRAGLVPEPERSAILANLREYVHLRAEAARDMSRIPQVLERSVAIHNELWASTIAVAEKNNNPELSALLIDSVNTVIGFHTRRTVVNQYRIPHVIWVALYVVSLLTLGAVGYQFGYTSTRDVAISSILALTIAVVIAMIADLDRGYTGTVRVDQQPMVELDQKLGSSTGGLKPKVATP